MYEREIKYGDKLELHDGSVVGVEFMKNSDIQMTNPEGFWFKYGDETYRREDVKCLGTFEDGDILRLSQDGTPVELISRSMFGIVVNSGRGNYPIMNHDLGRYYELCYVGTMEKYGHLVYGDKFENFDYSVPKNIDYRVIFDQERQNTRVMFLKYGGSVIDKHITISYSKTKGKKSVVSKIMETYNGSREKTICKMDMNDFYQLMQAINKRHPSKME